MHRILEAVIDNSRVTLCILLMVVLAGSVARSTINVEAKDRLTKLHHPLQVLLGIALVRLRAHRS